MSSPLAPGFGKAIRSEPHQMLRIFPSGYFLRKEATEQGAERDAAVGDGDEKVVERGHATGERDPVRGPSDTRCR